MREQGLGVKVNLAAAYYWYTLAQRRGHEEATERLLGLRGKMTAEQIQKGEQMLTQHQQSKPASSPGQ
jgi:TPR repeat protein